MQFELFSGFDTALYKNSQFLINQTNPSATAPRLRVTKHRVKLFLKLELHAEKIGRAYRFVLLCQSLD